MRGDSLSEVNSSVQTQKSSRWKRLLAYIGPAYLISVGYMDPGNWATDIAGGSSFGYSLIWVLLMSNLIALLLQSLSARLGIVKGLDLAQASHHTYPPIINVCLYVLAQIAVIACDLAEVIGMAIGLKLLFGIPILWGISVTIFDTLLLLYMLNRGMRSMEVFIVSMVFIVGISFLTEMLIVKPHIQEVFMGFVPNSLTENQLYIAIGIIGATVMPHNLYLHSSLVQTRQIERNKKGIKEALKYNFIDTALALNLAFFVNAAILILAASAFYKNGYFHILEIEDAHHLLQNLFGKAAPILFAIALIASGQSSTITGTLAGQIIMEGHLNLRVQPWLRRFVTRILAIVPAVITILFFGENQINKLLVLSQVVLSIQLGFAIIPLIYFTSSKKYMGDFSIKTWLKILAWISASIIIGLNIRLVIQELHYWTQSLTTVVLIPIYTVVIGVFILLIYIIWHAITNGKIVKEKKHTLPIIDANITIQELIYSKIGITVDFSKSDNKALQYALRQGGKQAQYLLMHIVETAGARYYGKDVYDYETQEDFKNLQHYQQQLYNAGYSVDIRVGYGNAANAIASIAMEEEFDLLIMAAHGHRTFRDIVYGTTVDAVRHQVKMPILVV